MSNIACFGFAQRDITPTYKVQTVGFNRKDNMSRGVLHKLYAQTALWALNGEKCCLIAIDSIGFSCEESNILRDEVADQLMTTRDKVMLCFSHTHSAPNVTVEQAYFEYVRKKVLLTVVEAMENMRPVRVVWGQTQTDIGQNRRNEKGATDRRVGVLKVADADTGNVRLLMLRVTAHNNVLRRDNYYISSDFIGITRHRLESKYGCKVMITQGAAGNIKPSMSGTVEALEWMASRIELALEGWVDRLTPRTVEHLTMVSKKAAFYAEVPTMSQAWAIAKEAMQESKIDGTDWLAEIERLHKEKVMKQRVEIEVQHFRVNNGCLCGVPNEIMCELALEASRKCKNPYVYLGAYTNGCTGYLPTAEEYDRGGYEVLHSYLLYYKYSGMVMPLHRDTADQLVDAVVKQWRRI